MNDNITAPLRKSDGFVGVASATACSGFFVHGWARAWSKLAFCDYMESVARSKGHVEFGQSHRAYWTKKRAAARKRLQDAASKCGATLKFGAWNSVEIHIPNT